RPPSALHAIAAASGAPSSMVYRPDTMLCRRHSILGWPWYNLLCCRARGCYQPARFLLHGPGRWHAACCEELGVAKDELDVGHDPATEPKPSWAARGVEKISIVMPCLNEEDSIACCIAWAQEGLSRIGL